MLFAQSISPDGWVAIAIAVICGVLSYIASEATRRYAWGKRDGELDTKAKTLADNLVEFKKTVSDAIKELKDFQERARIETKADLTRVYDLMTNVGSSHKCYYERLIGEMGNQIKTNSGRVDELEKWRHECERDAAAKEEA